LVASEPNVISLRAQQLLHHSGGVLHDRVLSHTAVQVARRRVGQVAELQTGVGDRAGEHPGVLGELVRALTTKSIGDIRWKAVRRRGVACQQVAISVWWWWWWCRRTTAQRVVHLIITHLTFSLLG